MSEKKITPEQAIETLRDLLDPSDHDLVSVLAHERDRLRGELAEEKRGSASFDAFMQEITQLEALREENQRLRAEIDETGECVRLCTPEAQRESAQLREALERARDAITSPYMPHSTTPPRDIYDTPMMSKALRSIDAALRGREQPEDGIGKPRSSGRLLNDEGIPM